MWWKSFSKVLFSANGATFLPKVRQNWTTISMGKAQRETNMRLLFTAGGFPDRAARIARLPRSLLDPESFPHTAYVKILATLARKTVN